MVSGPQTTDNGPQTKDNKYTVTGSQLSVVDNYNRKMNEQNNIEEEVQETEELYEKLTIVIDKGQDPLRIDKFLMSRIEGATRNKIQQAIDNEMVLVNEKPI